jgi:DNA mismatch endonuclease (patch repair protein)
MAAIRSSGTSPELRLAVALKALFPRRRIVERPRELPGRPDFYLPGLSLAIFADGCFWHCCPEHGRVPGDNREYWEPKLARNAARDREAGKALRRLGIRPVRLWEHELRIKTIGAGIRRVSRAAQRPPLRSGRKTRAASVASQGS